MNTLSISAIWFDRDTRQRTSLGDLNDLMISISQVGLINPVVVTRDGQLIAGERRLTACKELGWTSIPITYLEDLTPVQLEQVELDENIKRLDLDWRDRVRAVERYVQLVKQEDGAATLETIGDRLGFTGTHITQCLGVATMLASGDERVAAADKFSVARGIWERSQQRAKASALETVDALTSVQPSGESSAVAKQIFPELEDEDEDAIPLINFDFHEFVKDGPYQGHKFNFIHCDFPYGINAESHDQGAASSFGGYADGEDIYWKLIATLEEAMDDCIADSAHLMFWFSMKFYKPTLVRLTEIGWTVNPTPLIWHRSDNSGILPDPKRGPRQVYETALMASRGDRYIVGAKSNLFASPNTKSVHMSEKPRPVLDHFFRMFIDEHTVFLDPTCGSGNSVIVAEQLGAKHVLGIEKDPEFWKLATENWRDNR